MGIVQSAMKKLMHTESEWNPKVMAGRALTAMVPPAALHSMMKRYYANLLARAPSDWAETDRAAVGQLVTQGDEVVDVGASIGGYTKFLSAKTRRVYSFEPNPEIYDFLAYNVRRFRLANVETFPFALSDSERTDKMVIPRYRWGSECHYDATIDPRQQKAGLRTVNVQVKTLDSILSGKPISFIKCDVNGHELGFLKGALRIIRACKPGMLMELLEDPDIPGSDAHQVFSTLAKEGYTVYRLDGNSLRKRQPGERNQNYFFLPTSMSRA